MKRLMGSVLCVLPLVCIGGVYQYKDANGNTVFTDVPPAAKATAKDIKVNSIQTSGGGYTLREAMRKNPVVLWTNDCGSTCTDAQSLLQTRGVPYALRNPQASAADFAALKAVAGDTVVPVLQMGSKVLKGFLAEDWHSTLDQGGYPRAADPTAKGLQPKDAGAKPGTAPTPDKPK